MSFCTHLPQTAFLPFFSCQKCHRAYCSWESASTVAPVRSGSSASVPHIWACHMHTHGRWCSSPASGKQRSHASLLSHNSLPCVFSHCLLWRFHSLLVEAELLGMKIQPQMGNLPWEGPELLTLWSWRPRFGGNERTLILSRMRGYREVVGNRQPSQSTGWLAGRPLGQEAPTASCGFRAG